MKIIPLLFLFFLLSLGNLFAQENNLYTITYIDSLNNETSFSNINVTNLDNNYISFERVYNRGDNITPIRIYRHRVELGKINSFGYRAYTPLGKRITTGALIGTGTGILLGGVAGSLKWGEGKESHTLEGALAGAVLGAFTGSVIGGITGIGAKEYETVNFSKYSNQKKYEIIQRLVLKGIEFNKEEE